MRIDEQGNAVPGPTSVLPSTQLAASYNRFDDEDDEGLDSDLPIQPETENF
jgi:DNA-directed RNA polymerase subunit alpha